MEDMGLNETVEEDTADGIKFTLDCGSGCAAVGSDVCVVMRKSRINVLEVDSSN
jgi:hypothetical protein